MSKRRNGLNVHSEIALMKMKAAATLARVAAKSGNYDAIWAAKCHIKHVCDDSAVARFFSDDAAVAVVIFESKVIERLEKAQNKIASNKGGAA